MIVFRTGNTAWPCAPPALFRRIPALPLTGTKYVDGGLVSPVSNSRCAVAGSRFCIAVDISDKPQNNKTDSSIE